MTGTKDTKKFLDSLSLNAAMREELAGQLQGADDQVGVVVSFAEASGFEVDREELIRACTPATDGEGLSDDQLDHVAGGAVAAVPLQFTQGDSSGGKGTVVHWALEVRVNRITMA